MWKNGTLHWVKDARWPTLMPQEGRNRNIYAPTVIREKRGFRIYFGGWDGTADGHDRISTTTTDDDFSQFSPHQLVIDNGPFIHVNNGSAVRLPDGHVYLMATTYPDARDTNKPAVFNSADGLRFNERLPYVPAASDKVTISGYPNFEGADINGMNVLLREGTKWRLYFGDFKHWGKVYRASGDDAREFRFDGPVLDEGLMVNDVKRFSFGKETYALMLLHHNGNSLKYTLSTDTSHFPPTKTLFENSGDEDRYIVAVGLVTDGKRPLGVLYGAGAVPSLDHNRIFARWLQKRVRFVTDAGDVAEEGRAKGPSRFTFPLSKETQGRFIIESEDGVTRLYTGPEVTVKPGEVWRFRPF
jgi:hypothetical protein